MRKNLYFSPAMRRGLHGGLPKAPPGEGEGGGGVAGGDDNFGGNPGGGASGAGESNNGGQDFDATSFWGNSEGGDGSDPSGESAQGGAGDGSGSSGESLQQVLTGRLESMTFGEPVFTPEIAEQINAGNFEGVESRIQTQMRNSVRNALSMMVSILKPFSEQLTEQMRGEMNNMFNSRDDSSALETMFPAAKNPAVRPMIQSIYMQALKNSKGNREKAVSQTKEMLKFAAGVSAEDLDITVNPRGAGDEGRPQTATNWLDELTVR